MKTLNIGLTAVLVLSLAGCSWLGLRDRGNDYLLAEETEPTVIPAEMQVDRAAALGQLYPIPLIPTTSVEAEGFEVPAAWHTLPTDDDDGGGGGSGCAASGSTTVAGI
jgi:uncharacterized lipoprotein